MSDVNPTLADEFLLLARRGSDGRPLIGSTEVNCGVAGALLAELALAERIRFTEGRITLVNAAPVGDPDLDATVRRIAQGGRPRTGDWWVRRLSRHGRRIRKRRLAVLIEAGVLDERRHGVLGAGYTRHPVRDLHRRQEIHARLRAVLDGSFGDERTTALLAITHACDLNSKLFPDLERDALNRRVTEVTDGQWAGIAVAGVIVSMYAGAMAG